MTTQLKRLEHQATTLRIAERFFDTCVLFALHELGVFRVLADGPRTLPRLSEEIGGDKESLRSLLDAAVALKILEKEEDRYRAGASLIETLAQSDSSAGVGAWIRFLRELTLPLFQLSDTVRRGRPAGLIDDAVDATHMAQAMDVYARSRGDELAERIDFSAALSLLDVGCGTGAYSLAILAKHPQLTATLLDLEPAIDEARKRLADRGMSERVELIAGDALTYITERRYDVILVSNVLHMIGPSQSRELLRRLYGHLRPGGRILVQAQFSNEDRTSPRWPALLDLILHVTTPHGRNHTVRETDGWLREAGFSDIEHVRFSAANLNSVLVGRRAS